MISSSPQIRVAVADDHSVFREGLVVQITNEPDMTVVSTAEDADAAVREVCACKPDVLLLDIEMPGLDAFTAVGILAERQPDVRVILLSAFTHDVYIGRAIKAKAWGYVSKNEPFNTVCDAIREVHRSWVYYSSDVKARIVNTPDGPTLQPQLCDGAASRVEQLTPRETELLIYLARGLSTKQLAHAMGISAKTVDNHKVHLMNKLAIHDRVELARFAFREGIATP